MIEESAYFWYFAITEYFSKYIYDVGKEIHTCTLSEREKKREIEIAAFCEFYFCRFSVSNMAFLC